jgi:tetratricopeptide (TPR) repeat protein
MILRCAQNDSCAQSDNRLARFLVIAAVAAAALIVAQGAVPAVASAPLAYPLATNRDLEDAPEPLRGNRSRSETEADRIEALALFAAGRTHEQRQEYDTALRCYARAFRCDPQSVVIVDAIVPLAYQQKVEGVWIRYGMKAAELGIADAPLLRHLGVYYTGRDDFKQALSLYEKAVALQESEKEDEAAVVTRMELGRICHLLGHYHKAATQFSRVIYALDHPAEFGLSEKARKVLLWEPAPTYQLFGESFLLADRLDEARKAFAKADQLAPNSALRDFNMARVDFRAGNAAQALAGMQAYFDKHLISEGTVPYELLAEVLKKLGREKELLGRLEKLRQADPDNVALGYGLAAQYVAVGAPDKAQTLYESLLKKGPTAIGYRALAERYRKTKQVAVLLALLGDVAEKTGSLEVLGDEAKHIVDDRPLVESLIAAARKNFRAPPEKGGFGARLAMALVAMEAKQYEAGGEFFQAAIAARPKQAGELQLAWGVGLLGDDRPADAVKVFQRGLDERLLPESNPAFYFYLAGALEICHRTEEALAAAQKAVELKKDSARFASRLPWILFHAKRNAEAQRAYANFVAAFDGDRQSAETRQWLREARLALSNLCVLAGDIPAAEEWLQQVLDEFPDDIAADNDLGYLWADENRHLQRALGMIQRAVTSEPDNGAYRDSLGWVYYRLGRLPEAIAELEKAIAADKEPDGAVLEHLGDVLAKAGQGDKARDVYRRAAAAFRKEKEETKAKQVETKQQRSDNKH